MNTASVTGKVNWDDNDDDNDDCVGGGGGDKLRVENILESVNYTTLVVNADKCSQRC